MNDMRFATIVLRLRMSRWIASLRSAIGFALVSCSCLPGTAAPDAAAILAQEPLATCEVTAVKPPQPVTPPPGVLALGMNEQESTDPLDNYSRGPDGQWVIPAEVDRANPWVRLLVFAPDRPMLVDIAIFIDGKPFTAAREELIDNLLDHATVESLVREAVNVPLPEDLPATQEVESSEKTDSIEADNLTAQESSEKEVAESEETKKEVKPAKPERTDSGELLIEAKRRAARTVAQRLVNYLASSEVEADREEVRWLLAEWTGGSALLTLGPAASWQRSGVAPLWNVLDMDRDDSLSPEEIQSANERLSQADVDGNGIVDLSELTNLAPPVAMAAHSYPLLEPLDQTTDWQRLASELQEAYSRRGTPEQGNARPTTPALLDRISQGAAALEPDELSQLLDEPAEVAFRVELAGKQNRLGLLTVSPESSQADGKKTYSTTPKKITVARGATYLEVTASCLSGEEPSEPLATQIAVGAVDDGFPLFRLVDHNGDRRLTSREQRELPALLKALDLDGNKKIDSTEKPTAIRLAIAQGPQVHTQLASPVSAERVLSSRAGEEESSQPTAPPWFMDMDRNHDGDLSRGEFLGTSEQFTQFDRDEDGLVSGQEAQKLDDNN